MRNRQTSTTIALCVVVAVLAAGCGDGDAEGPTTTITPTSTSVGPDTTTTEPATSTTVAPSTTTTTEPLEGHAVYFLLDELEQDAGGPYLVPVYRAITVGDDLPLAVTEALLDGPTAEETAGIPAITTAIPDDTTALGVEVDGGTATVDLSAEYGEGGGSASMFGRLAQVVYTLTRLPDITEVEFAIEGEPVALFSAEGIELEGAQARDDFYDWLPPIFVDHPAWGEPVTSPIAVSGLSNVFEAVSQVMLTDDDGLPLFEDTVMATCGTGCWGEWNVEIPFTIDRDQFGALIVWENSAKDGSQINIREYPIQLRGES
ncbi:MAG TPA: GerMN domain-containing protein [Acidimicrobiia bacterium]